MKKRILGIFLALSMVLSTFTAFAYDDVVTTLEKTSVSLVEGLGIMSAKDGESFGSMEYMTRGDFALAVAKMLNYDVTEGKMGNSAFSDVDISTEQGCAVNLLADTGIIPTDSNKMCIRDSYYYIEEVPMRYTADEEQLVTDLSTSLATRCV